MSLFSNLGVCLIIKCACHAALLIIDLWIMRIEIIWTQLIIFRDAAGFSSINGSDLDGISEQFPSCGLIRISPDIFMNPTIFLG